MSCVPPPHSTLKSGTHACCHVTPNDDPARSPVNLLFPFSSRSSTGTFNHIFTRCSTCFSTTLLAMHYPIHRRVSIHIVPFEACSSFTRIAASQIARPPYVNFVARFRSALLPAMTARQLSNLTINCSSGSFPYWYSAHFGHTQNPARRN